MTLNANSIDWAIDFVACQSDGDLFPKLPEMEAIAARKADLIQLIENKPLNAFQPEHAGALLSLKMKSHIVKRLNWTLRIQ